MLQIEITDDLLDLDDVTDLWLCTAIYFFLNIEILNYKENCIHQ